MKINQNRKRQSRGFSLVELMIVIAIIGLLIGVGVPAWTYVVRNGNETSAIQTLNTIRTLQAQYASKHRGNFGNFDELIEKVGFDEKFKGERPVVNGYVFTIKVVPQSSNQPASYSVNADPQVSEGLQATGSRHFYVDNSVSTIKSNDAEPAKPTDPSV
jgi:prepilin-type N-terminal cleavage/methylation domain-containing protein